MSRFALGLTRRTERHTVGIYGGGAIHKTVTGKRPQGIQVAPLQTLSTRDQSLSKHSQNRNPLSEHKVGSRDLKKKQVRRKVLRCESEL